MSDLEERKGIGERLRQARLYLGFTQSWVAKQAGLHRPTLSLLEHGQRRCDSVKLARLAKLYERPASWFLGEAPAIQEPLFTGKLARAFELLTEHDRKAVLDFADYLASRSHG